MEDFKPTPFPFQSRVKMSLTCTSPKVDATLYCQLVGILLYLTHSHRGISFVVCLIARYMECPHEIHWKESKSTLRYIYGIVKFQIHYNIGETPLLVGLIDSDWVGDPNDHKSTTGYVFTLGSGPIT
jgi:hypothetical protein